jgi:hypothetical protein
MSEENEDIRIEGDVATWEMHMDGDILGTYVGVFKFRCYLDPLSNIAAGAEQRALLGSNMALATDHDSFLAYALTQLKQRIISAPPFWASASPNKAVAGNLPDENVIEAVLDAAVRSEIKYKLEKKKRKEEAIERANAAIIAMKEKKRKDAELEAEEPVEVVQEAPKPKKGKKA